MNYKGKMLVIDDNSMIRALLTADFDDDFEVKAAASGTEGLEVAMQWRPDVILLDINATQSRLQPFGNFKGFLSKLTPTEDIRKTINQVLR